MLKTERDDLTISYENLSAEKDSLQRKVTKLETEKATTEEREKQYQMQVAALEGFVECFKCFAMDQLNVNYFVFSLFPLTMRSF